MGPGPGAYDIPSKAIEGHKLSIRGKHKHHKKIEDYPGPGMYNIMVAKDHK